MLRLAVTPRRLAMFARRSTCRCKVIASARSSSKSRVFSTLWDKPIGTREAPATDDRFMDAPRFASALTKRQFPLVAAGVATHAAAAYAICFAVAPGALELCLFGVSYTARMFGITAGYHRYFSHASYQTTRSFQCVLALLGASSWQKGPIWWASHHIEHHLYSDTDRDAHSPVSGSPIWAHVGWFWGTKENDDHAEKYTAGNMPRVQRLHDNFPELAFIDKYHQLPGVALMALCYAADGGAGVLWGFAVPTVALWHSTYMVNSVCHIWGSRRFETTDNSRNNPIVALLTMGEGWHNNHHVFHWSARQGLMWWEVDLSYCILCALEKVGVVWGLKVPSDKQVAKLIEKGKTNSSFRLRNAIPEGRPRPEEKRSK